MAQVSGMGGVGKSLLAEEYALRFGAAYPGGVFWLRAMGHDAARPAVGREHQDAVRSEQFHDLAVALGIDVAGLSPPEVEAALPAAFEKGGQSFLWVVDDLASGLDGELADLAAVRPRDEHRRHAAPQGPVASRGGPRLPAPGLAARRRPHPGAALGAMFARVGQLDEEAARRRTALALKQADAASLAEHAGDDARVVHTLIARAVRFHDPDTRRSDADSGYNGPFRRRLTEPVGGLRLPSAQPRGGRGPDGRARGGGKPVLSGAAGGRSGAPYGARRTRGTRSRNRWGARRGVRDTMVCRLSAVRGTAPGRTRRVDAVRTT